MRAWTPDLLRRSKPFDLPFTVFASTVFAAPTFRL